MKVGDPGSGRKRRGAGLHTALGRSINYTAVASFDADGCGKLSGAKIAAPARGGQVVYNR
jgi:hypothetical protein